MTPTEQPPRQSNPPQDRRYPSATRASRLISSKSPERPALWIWISKAIARASRKGSKSQRAAAASYSVEPLSPMAPPDAQAAASYGCSAVLSYWLRWLRVPIDWGQSIYHNDAQRRRLMAVRLFCPTGCGGFRFRSIGDNRSTITTRKRRCLMAVRLFCPTGCGGFVFRSIGDNRSTITTRSGGVLRLFGCFFRSDDQTKNW
jgi:hypothetical protein